MIEWLQARTPQFREAVEYVAIDPAAVYAAALRTEGLLPNATIVVDHFHLVKLANDALSRVRRRVTWDLRDRRGRKIDPEWANRRRLLTARERLSGKSFAKMWNRISDEDPSAQILSAWIAKEELRTLLSTVRVGGDAHLTRHRLHRLLTWCVDSQIPELVTLAATVDAWWPEIDAFVRTGITNARTEGYNRLVKQVKRVGCGYRNTDNSMRRIRFHCTRHARRAAQTMLTADAADSMAVELLIAINPDEDSRLPYLLRVPLAGGDLLFRTSGTWPRTKALYCYPVPLDEWPDEAVIVERVGCGRVGGAVQPST